jgi:hypothetical protein
MGKKTWWIVILCALGTTGLVWAAAAELSIKNVVVQELSATAGLRTEVQRLAEQRQGPRWIGYEVPLVSGIGGICCAPGATCALEGEAEQVFQSQQAARSPHPDLMVLLRVHEGRVTQIRSLTTDCSVDAGGLPLLWLRNVDPADSVALLGSLKPPEATESEILSAIFAIGAHAGKAADKALNGFVRAGTPEVRQRALARIGNARGREGFETLRAMLDEKVKPEVREQALFALAWSHEPEAEGVLLQAAREDRDAKVRSQALVVFARLAGQRALPVLSQAVAQDSSRKVRSTAVFALRYLPEVETRETLENLARQAADPEIRQQAQFMLDRMNGRELLGPPARTRRPL